MLCSALLAGVCSCNDELILPDYPAGGIESEGEARVSVFHLSAQGSDFEADGEDVVFHLVNPETELCYNFSGSIQHAVSPTSGKGTGLFECRLRIGTSDIPDGLYYLSVMNSKGGKLGLRLIRFKNNIGTEEETEPMKYDDLQGAGTKENPYLINDAGDFLTLQWYLEEDPRHASGYYFLQTSDFELPRRSQMIDGHVWLSCTFAGYYDGGGHKMSKLIYQGGGEDDSDSGIGLFSDMIDAEVNNLTITDILISNAHSRVGAIAGSTYGTCRISNVSIDGTIIANGSYLGGIVGYSGGGIELQNINVNSFLLQGAGSSTGVGAMIGYAFGTYVRIDNVAFPDHIFSITGGSSVGGIVGEAAAMQSLEISNVKIEHSVDHESAGTRIIYGSGNNVGGICGKVGAMESVRLENITVKAPVRGNDNVGGICGYASDIKEIGIKSALLTSVVNGNDAVGGYFGRCILNGGKLNIGGAEGSNRFVVKSSAAADLQGNRYAGGLAGYIDAQSGSVNIDTAVEIAVNISGTESVGGAFGYAVALNEFNPGLINFSSTTMRVTATNRNAGGVAGYLSGGSLKGDVKLDLKSSIPEASEIPSHFSGVVNAGRYAGGVVGWCTGQLTGLSSAATVTADSDAAGGIAAFSDGNLEMCAFKGSVSCPDKVAGIVAYSCSALSFKNLLNLADITGGRYQGGVIGYIYHIVPGDSSLVTYYPVIEYCYNKGNLNDGIEVGGILACAETYSSYEHAETNVRNCGNSGNIIANGNKDCGVGGIVGRMMVDRGNVSGCANHGNVSSKSVQKSIGGVVGVMGNDATVVVRVEYCMNSGKIDSSVTSTKLGGVCGHLMQGNSNHSAIVRDCYNVGAISADQKDDTGGILGYVSTNGDIHRTFNSGKISHGNAIIGTHNATTIFYHSHNYYLDGSGGGWPSSTKVSASQVTDKSVYSNFDFNNVWMMGSEGPVLRDCPFQ